MTDLLTVAEAAQALGVTTRWLQAHRLDGPPRVRYPGRRVIRYLRQDLDAWLQAHREGTCDTTSSGAAASTTSASGDPPASSGSGGPPVSEIAARLRAELLRSPPPSPRPHLHLVAAPR